ncbi:hypothetical protein NIES4074_30750 [Cylindrospermum sp. NIES-4074]|nr:hypothetical protein NIES4074_30750 [Cylindrospermum sp. NIES-4074]
MANYSGENISYGFDTAQFIVLKLINMMVCRYAVITPKKLLFTTHIGSDRDYLRWSMLKKIKLRSKCL